MKRCKTCGTIVHIESNTCPNCGEHGFEVLDVKVCPLCGKVNDVNSAFCEYCGKSFEIGYPAGGYPRLDPDLLPPEEDLPERRMPETDEGFGARRELSDAERAMLHYLTLRPEVSSDGKEKKYAYYVTEETVPIVILPTFDTEKEKNIRVEILMIPDGRQAPAGSVVERDEEGGDGMQLQLPRVSKRRDLFSERKVSRRTQTLFSVLFTILALGAFVGFCLPLAGPDRTAGFSLLLGMIGYHEGGQAVIELIKAGGALGVCMYVGLLALFSLTLLCTVLNLCFLRHKRVQKIILLVLWALAFVAALLVMIGNIAVLKVPFGQMGAGLFVTFGCIIVGFVTTLILYDR